MYSERYKNQRMIHGTIDSTCVFWWLRGCLWSNRMLKLSCLVLGSAPFIFTHRIERIILARKNGGRVRPATFLGWTLLIDAFGTNDPHRGWMELRFTFTSDGWNWSSLSEDIRVWPFLDELVQLRGGSGNLATEIGFQTPRAPASWLDGGSDNAELSLQAPRLILRIIVLLIMCSGIACVSMNLSGSTESTAWFTTFDLDAC